MDRETFWEIVDAARDRAGAGADDRGAEDDPLPDVLTDLLVERLSPDEILAFADVVGAVATASLIPVSALARRFWMPCVVTLSCCDSACAALMTPIRADCESGLVDSPCIAVVN